MNQEKQYQQNEVHHYDNNIAEYPAQDEVDYTSPVYNPATIIVIAPSQPAYYPQPQQPAYPAPQPVQYTQQQQQQPQTTAPFVVQKNFEFLKTPPGILNIINIVLLFFAWIIMAAWRGHIGSFFVLHHGDGSSFFLLTVLLPFFIIIAYVIAVVIGLDKRIMNVFNVQISVIIHCAVSALLLLISSSIVARRGERDICLSVNCSVLEAAAAFGFLSAFGLIMQGILYFKHWRSGKGTHTTS